MIWVWKGLQWSEWTPPQVSPAPALVLMRMTITMISHRDLGGQARLERRRWELCVQLCQKEQVGSPHYNWARKCHEPAHLSRSRVERPGLQSKVFCLFSRSKKNFQHWWISLRLRHRRIKAKNLGKRVMSSTTSQDPRGKTWLSLPLSRCCRCQDGLQEQEQHC